MSNNSLVPRYVGLKPRIDKIVEDLANQEEGGEISAMIRKLVEEALKERGLVR